jgi:hypothetical protein
MTENPQAVENIVDGDVSVPTDDKGRPLPEYLSDRVLLIEIATHLRVMYDAISDAGCFPASWYCSEVIP